jgi:HK97 family phage major capsid protein
MNPKEKALKELNEKLVALKALTEKDSAGWTADDVKSAKSLNEDVKALKSQIAEFEAQEALVAEAKSLVADSQKTVNSLGSPNNTKSVEIERATGAMKTVRVSGSALKSKYYDDAEDAYKVGQFLLTMKGAQNNAGINSKRAQWLKENFATDEKDVQTIVAVKAMTEGTNADGGYLVPTILANRILMLQENYGIIPQVADVVQMPNDKYLYPKNSSFLSTYLVGEGSNVTDSKLSLSQVSLDSKKIGGAAAISYELTDDASINVADLVTLQLGKAFAKGIDVAGFNGDGTADDTNLGVTGLKNALAAGCKVTGAAGGWTALTLANFQKAIAIVPEYVDAEMYWCCTRVFFYSVMLPLYAALGGATSADIVAAYGSNPMFLGYPVKFTQVMPKTTAIDQICAYFGDFDTAMIYGIRKNITIEPWRTPQNQLFTYYATERFDVKVHDLGDSINSGAVSCVVTAHT